MWDTIIHISYILYLAQFLQVKDCDLVAEKEVIKELKNEDPKISIFASKDRSEAGVVIDEIRNIIVNATWTNYVLHQ